MTCYLLASFSLLGGLALDLDVDDDVLGQAPAPISHPEVPTRSAPTQAIARPAASHAIPTIDTSLPLFFSPFAAQQGKRDQKAFNFYRTETAEEIRQRWMNRKGELTGEWKRRHREAVKSLRRRGGGVAD